MNRLQKMAWFNLMIIAISLGLCVGATTVLALLIGMPAALAGFVFMGFGGIIGISPIIFRKRRKPVTFDERDEAVMISLERVVKGCKKMGVTSSICGQAPSVYPELTEKLVEWGITSVSVSPDMIDITREIIAKAEARLKTR